MTELLLVSITTLLCLGVIVYQVRLLSMTVMHLEVRNRERELAYLRMIRDLHNRLTAKDLSGYMALRADEGSKVEFAPRDDEHEAMIERLKSGVLPNDNGAF